MMFGEKYDYSFRLNSQIQSICKFMVVMWHGEIKARADDQTDEQNRMYSICKVQKIRTYSFSANWVSS